MKDHTARFRLFLCVLLAAAIAPWGRSQTAAPSAGRTRLSLDGDWQVAADPSGQGEARQWQLDAQYPAGRAKQIPVPGNTYQALPKYNGLAWYRREFNVPAGSREHQRAFLQFESVQYACQVWLNGQTVGAHRGSESSFEFEVTGRVAPGRNVLIVQVDNPTGIFTNGKVPVFWDQGGILGHVSLVEQPPLRIAEVYARPDWPTGAIAVDITCDNAGAAAAVELEAAVSEKRSGRQRDRRRVTVQAPAGVSVQHLTLQVADRRQWDLDNPFLYSLTIRTSSMAGIDLEQVERLGFRDFRIVDGYFQLNGRRIFLKGCHQNRYDPLLVEGVASDLRWLGRDAAQLKAAGFNLYRAVGAALMPEQLAIADEVGLLMYSEHTGSWLLRDASKFREELIPVFHQNRHSPSWVMFGLLNEIDSRSPGVYATARASLPSLRAVDPTRLIMLSSGRWDRDFTRGSASNPGSTAWDTYLGGEGPQPKSAGVLPDLPDSGNGIPNGGYSEGGDVHIYNAHPTSGEFIAALRTLGRSTGRIWVSEAGTGGAADPYTERRHLLENHAAADATAWGWTNPPIAALEAMWQRYGLSEAYPEIPTMIADSQRAQAAERDLLTRAIRSNPRISGYSLTSMTDAMGLGEGIWDNFREWKPGHQAVVTAGWAKTRFCLFVGPRPVAARQPLRLTAVLADEDRLEPGAHTFQLRVRDQQGVERWHTTGTIQLGARQKRPFAVTCFEAELPAFGLGAGSAVLEATLDREDSLPGSRLAFAVLTPGGATVASSVVAVVGVPMAAQAILARNGARVREFDSGRGGDREVIVSGPDLPAEWKAANWRDLYHHVERGAHLLIVGPRVMQGSSGPLHFLPLVQRGELRGKVDMAIYHRDVIAKPSPVFAGLPDRLLTGESYGQLLHGVSAITGMSSPERTLAVAFNPSGMGPLADGVVLATWRLGGGEITVCTWDLLHQMGEPVPDRLLCNLVNYARAHSGPEQPLPPGSDAELDRLGIKE